MQNPPSIAIRYIKDYIVGDFNKENYIFSWAKDSPLLDEHDSTLRIIPSDRQDEEFSHYDYCLANKSDKSNITRGCRVYHTSGLAPPLDEENTNVLVHSFGIEFEISRDGDTQQAVWPISSYKHTTMFNLTKNISLNLTELDFFHLPDTSIPGKTSASLINYVYESLISIRNNSLDVFVPEVDAPAFRTRVNRASTSPSIFFSSAVGARFPSDAARKEA